jgi:hypothetical protein
MNKPILISLLTVLLLLSCKSKDRLSFCEGTTPEGEGVKCGTTFTTGDLTAVVTLDGNVAFDKIDFSVYKKEKYKKDKISSLSVKVPADKMTVAAPLSFYAEGVYVIRVSAKDDASLTEKEITIVDTY